MKRLDRLSETDQKVCSKCKQEKSTQEFHKSKYQATGYACHCKACDKVKGGAYHETHKEQKQEYGKKYNLENREKIRSRLQKWRAKNPEKDYQYHVKWAKESPVYKYSQSIKHRLYLAWSDKIHPHRPLMAYLGLASVGAFRQYLLSTFFKTYGRFPNESDRVNIDHTIPICTARSIEEVDALNRIENLQLLTEEDNLKKGTKYET